MNIDSREVLNYIKVQKATFEMLKLSGMPNLFNDGLIEGLNLVRVYLEMLEDKEVKSIVDNYNEEEPTLEDDFGTENKPEFNEDDPRGGDR
jgi:hypothetical protein